MAHLTRSSDAVESTNLLQTSSSGTRGKQRAASPSFTYESVNIRLLAGSTVLDDAVSIGVKRLGTTLIVSVSLWLLSYVVVMMQVIEKGHFVPFTSFLFIPMWTGSVYGFASVTVILIGVCKNGGTLISKERKLFMQAQGVELEQYIDFESLPLMRRLFFWSSVLATFLMLSFTTQIFLYLWLVAGVIGMWHAFYPVLLVFILLLTYLMLVRTLSPSTCWCFALSFVGLLLYAAKCKNELGLNWIVTLSPIAAVEIILLSHAAWVFTQVCRRRFSLSIRQSLCLGGYTCSILAAIAAEAITAIRDFPKTLPSFKLTEAEVLTIPMILWVGAGVLFSASALAIVQQELGRIADSRGYTDPIPLSRSISGWEVVKGYRETASVLLGVIRIPAPLLNSVSVRRSRPGSRSSPGAISPTAGRLSTDKNEILTISTNQSPLCSEFGRGGSSRVRGNRDGEDEEEEKVEEAQNQGAHTSTPAGIRSMMSDTAIMLKNSIRFFVVKTSLLQSVERNNGSDMLDIEMSRSRDHQHRLSARVRVNSGELDGGDEDF